mmetsp:Transcript_97586/g.279064  ORF Transcript_97586/g.279064 Transcript_97586/m.279064 type:complete len:156 (-) Transcript_97586:1169-1636(-)
MASQCCTDLTVNLSNGQAPPPPSALKRAPSDPDKCYGAEEDCPVCLGAIVDGERRRLGCGHHLCASCLESMRAHSHGCCPVCRVGFVDCTEMYEANPCLPPLSHSYWHRRRRYYHRRCRRHRRHNCRRYRYRRRRRATAAAMNATTNAGGIPQRR